jgi:predicted lipid-binding transport protein (Tim44 family)
LGVITPAAPRTLLIRSGRGSRERFGLLLLILVVEAMVGQIFLVTLVARLVAAFRSPQRAQHHEQPAQHPAPRNAPAERRPSSARRWRHPHRPPAAAAGRPAAGPGAVAEANSLSGS